MMMHAAAPHIDIITAAEQVSQRRDTSPTTVPELSPSDPTSSCNSSTNSVSSSPSSSAPVTPLDAAPPPGAPFDPFVHGKHQPDPRPFRPITKAAAVAAVTSSSRGTVWRARQALRSLGKRKRPRSADTNTDTDTDTDTGISTGVGVGVHDASEISDTPEAAELPVGHKSLFSLPNVPIDSITQARSQIGVRSPAARRHSTHSTLPSAPASPTTTTTTTTVTTTTARSSNNNAPAPRRPPNAPYAPPGLSTPPLIIVIARVIFFLPWCITVGASIALYPRSLPLLVNAYAGPFPTPLHRLAHHAHTARAHVGIFLGALAFAVGVLLPSSLSWTLRVALVGVVGARAVSVWRGFGARVEEEEKEGRMDGDGDGEEWCDDARCVWRVLRGEEESEVLRACGEIVKKDE